MNRTILLVLCLLISATWSGVKAQCPNGKPCELRPVGKAKSRSRDVGEKPFPLPRMFPVSNPPSLGENPFQGREPDQEYVNLSVMVRDQKKNPWTNAEVGISDDRTWVGNSTGFKFEPPNDATYNGKTLFTDVPCDRPVKFIVFYKLRGMESQTTPRYFILKCQKRTQEMFFVLSR